MSSSPGPCKKQNLISNEFESTKNSENKFILSKKGDKIFITSPYYADNQGRLAPDPPCLCPLQIHDKRPCEIIRHYFRDRQTGPCFPLLVLKCLTHKIGFTIYPPGYTPHGRKLLAPVAPDGCYPTTEKSGALRFEDTIFDAALDAANRVFWPYESLEGYDVSRRITQKRHLDRAALILGVHPELDERVREELAQILSVPGQNLHDCAKNILENCDDHSRGKAICTILSLIEASACMFSRLAEAGAVVCLWPWPERWDPRLKILRSSPFRPNRTRGAPP